MLLSGDSLSACSAEASGGRRRLSSTTGSVSVTGRVECPGPLRSSPPASQPTAAKSPGGDHHFGERLRHSACKRLTKRACSGLARPC